MIQVLLIDHKKNHIIIIFQYYLIKNNKVTLYLNIMINPIINQIPIFNQIINHYLNLIITHYLNLIFILIINHIKKVL